MVNWMRHGLILGGLGITLSLTACGQSGSTGAAQTEAGGVSSPAAEETLITGNGSSVTVEGEGAAADGSTVTVTAAGTYRLSGTVEDGQIRVDAGNEDEVELIFDGFSIANSNSSAIYGIQSKRIALVLADGTENTVSDGESYTYENAKEDEPDAAVFSKDDLVLEGNGTLTVNGNYQDAIRGKDGVTVRSGTYILTAQNDGIKGKDSVEIEGGTFTVTAGGDGIQSSNETEADKGYIRISGSSITVEADKKGILAATEIAITGGTFQLDTQDDAIHSDGNIKLSGGTYTLSCGDDAIHADQNVTIDDGKINIIKCYEGIEGLSIDVNGGDITLTAEDDGLNAAGGNDSSGNGGRFAEAPFSVTDGAYIRITGGTLRVDASGDGIDSNGSLYMDGGAVYVEGPENDGNGTIDFNGDGVINGGTFVGTGSSGMLQAFGSSSEQNLFVLYYDEEQTAGTKIQITDADGNEIAQITPAKKFSSLIFSSPELADGDSFQVTTGEAAVEITQNGVITQSGTPSGRAKGPMGGRGPMEEGGPAGSGGSMGNGGSMENVGPTGKGRPGVDGDTVRDGTGADGEKAAGEGSPTAGGNSTGGGGQMRERSSAKDGARPEEPTT